MSVVERYCWFENYLTMDYACQWLTNYVACNPKPLNADKAIAVRDYLMKEYKGLMFVDAFDYTGYTKDDFMLSRIDIIYEHLKH